MCNIILLNINKACLEDTNLHNSIKLLNSRYVDLYHIIVECGTIIYNYKRYKDF